MQEQMQEQMSKQIQEPIAMKRQIKQIRLLMTPQMMWM
jgi:hypothetical protein